MDAILCLPACKCCFSYTDTKTSTISVIWDVSIFYFPRCACRVVSSLMSFNASPKLWYHLVEGFITMLLSEYWIRLDEV